MKEIRIYFEGDPSLREGFGRFLSTLRDRVRERGIRWNVVAGRDRRRTFKSFCQALTDHPDAFNVLLVDSEAPVTEAPWAHLKRRPGDQWDRPGAADDDNCQFMAQMMESWFIADPDTLGNYYGEGFNRKALPPPNGVEARSKREVLDSLKAATRASKKRVYHKTSHAPDLLAGLNEQAVRNAAPHCDRLFRTLEKKLKAPRRT